MCGAANRMNIIRANCSGKPDPTGHACLSAATKELPVCNTSLSIGARLDDLIGRLSLEEKAGLIGPDPVTSPCAFLDYGVKRLDIPPYLHLVETNTAVASACIISQDTCATHLHWPHRVISTEMHAFNNLNWHRRGGVLQKIGLADLCLSGGYAAAYVPGCQDGSDRKYKKMAAGLRHIDAYSVETNRMAFNRNISTFDLWDTETLNDDADIELKETYFTTNGHLAQAVKHNRTTIDTENNSTVRRASLSARPVDPSLPSSNGRCISEYPDDGEYELGNACAECHITRVPSATTPDATHCLNLCDGNLTSRPPLRAMHHVWHGHLGLHPMLRVLRRRLLSLDRVQAGPEGVCLWQRRARPRVRELHPLAWSTSRCRNAPRASPPACARSPSSPTLTTDRLCSCDTLACNKLITQLFEEMVCADPTDEQIYVVLDVCCAGQGEDGIHNTIRQKARRSCPGCTDNHCEPIEVCERGQEEVAAPTRCSLDRVCRDCSAGTINSDSAGSTGCQICPTGQYTEAGSDSSCSSFTCRTGSHHHDSDPATTCKDVTECAPGGVPCLPVTTCDAGEEETVKPTPTSDRVCGQCDLGATFKPVQRPASASLARSRSQALTLDSDRECTLECSECPSGRFEIRACSALEDVQCAGCSACPPNTYILRACDSGERCVMPAYRSAPCTATSNTAYMTLDVCDQDQFELFPALTPTMDRICRDLTQCNPSTEYERTVCATSSPSATLASSASARQPSPPTPSASRAPSAPPTTTATRSPPASRAPYGHYVPAGSIGSCEQFLCPAGTTNLGLQRPHAVHARDCTPVTECDLGYEEVVRPTMRPTINTDRQYRRCIEGLFYRNSNTDFCARCLSNEYELVDTQSRREAFEAALGSVIATVASLNEDITVCLFSLFVSGDVTVMGFTASPCEADAFLDDSSLWLHGNELKASDAVDSWITTALLGETPAAVAVAAVVVVHAMATAATADVVVVVNVLAFLTSSSNSKEVVAVLLVGTHLLTIVGAMAGNSCCCNARQRQ
ncbi:hypothetical protein PTSG_06118 [Salpingoeca rosetta]|uniref:TNFR-Cys domain-containing protein n=1 Tax=Salpingoeca rosetta (strain ATCC 50818 / BSB-021) TaxID=946362 RepID=F2UC01_SALR5|nr:uncharacterized protein PTSG_06118 [Salpingoeca rosetta]EGD74108.1 hypothetical protein PTSG_06118 [Salpingoeca rosetta]|eukprot:XP_004993009.1 hypothetical protein PTSG_06118 [Salpingoeca rosetta]